MLMDDVPRQEQRFIGAFRSHFGTCWHPQLADVAQSAALKRILKSVRLRMVPWRGMERHSYSSASALRLRTIARPKTNSPYVSDNKAPLTGDLSVCIGNKSFPDAHCQPGKNATVETDENDYKKANKQYYSAQHQLFTQLDMQGV